jgi:hypothetical protein
LTLSISAFVLVAFWFAISFLNIKVGTWAPREFSEAAAMSFLSPCLLLYFSRRKLNGEQPLNDQTNAQTKPSSEP